MRTSHLLSLELATETKSILTPFEKRGSFQVVFIRSKDTGVMAWQGGSSRHPHQGGSMNGICHFLGIYRGAMPTNEVHSHLLTEARQLPEDKRKDFIINNLDVLYGYVQDMNNGQGGTFPIINGAPLSFFYTWEDYFAIENLMEKWGVYALTYRIELKTILPVLIGRTNETEPRLIFGVNAGGTSEKPCIKGMEGYIDFSTAEEQGNVGVWRSTESIVFPTVVPKEYWGLEEYQHQVAAIKAQDPAAKKANARNREANGGERIPYYQQDMGWNRPTIGQVSKVVNTGAMGMTPQDSTLDPVRASLG